MIRVGSGKGNIALTPGNALGEAISVFLKPSYLTGIRLCHIRELFCDYDVTSEGDKGDRSRFL